MTEQNPTIYHYPPELFELLVETIPLLFRSKKSVLTFFQGAGVDKGMLRDLEAKVTYDKENINKYEIVRITLTRLNEGGDFTLRARRVILKRVTEFEDFSTCWPDDQLKAKGLVSEVRRVVNVKDSFTRMQQEKEQERKKRIDKQQKKLDAIEQKNDALLKIKRDLFSLFAPTSQRQKRGKQLEGILNRLFEVNNILVREAFTVIEVEGEGVTEQIDGMIEINSQLYLVEMKWWEKPIGRGEISPHLVKLYGREGVRGIFISASGYTKPAIGACTEMLSQRVIILCDLQEFVLLLERNHDLKAFLQTKIEAALADKNPFYKLL